MGAEVFVRAVRATPAEMATVVLDVLGVESALAALDVADGRTIHNWIEGTREIRRRSLVRLIVVYQVVLELQGELPPAQIRQWFMSVNPEFQFRTAIQLLDDELAEQAGSLVVKAAADFTQQTCVDRSRETALGEGVRQKQEPAHSDATRHTREQI